MGKSIQTESRFMVTGGLSGGVGVGQGEWGATSNEYELPFRKDENIPKSDYGDGCPTW